MSNHSGLVVQKKKTVFWYSGLACLAIFLLLAAGLLGQSLGNRERESQLALVAQANEQIIQHEALIEQLQRQIDKQLAQIGVLKAEKQATGNSEAQAFKTIADLQEEIVHLKKDLAFYRNVMSPDAEQQGLQIEKFVAEKSKSSDDIRFKLSLIQTKKHTAYLSGSVKIALVGQKDGESTTIDLSSISNTPSSLKFRFKYLQHLSGVFTLPAGFDVETVKVSAKVRGRKRNTVDKEFQWQITETNSNVEQQTIQKQAES